MRWSLCVISFVWLLLAGCSGQPENEIQGYIEGDFVRVSLPESGVVETMFVGRGHKVEKGDPLVTLDNARESAALERARSEMGMAEAELANLKGAERDAQIQVLESEIEELQVNLDYATAAYNRHRTLSKTGASPVDDAERMKSQELTLKAKIKAAESRLQLARQSVGRENEIHAAQETLNARKATVREAEAKLALRRAVAPASALVNEVIYRPGETVTAGQAILELLPFGNVKARFYLSPSQVDRATNNPMLILRCDSCGDGIPAKVNFISPEASYRPPVLYSRNQSEKLAFLVEAIPLEDARLLHPGQPVTVVFPQ